MFKILKMFTSIVIVCILIFICVQFYKMFAYLDVPHSIKLADCTNSTVQFYLHIPAGNTHTLLLATPGIDMMKKLPYKFSGRVYISDGTLMTIEFPIDSDYVESCNWLRDSSSQILTGWNTNCPPLGQLVRAQKDYQFKIVFDKPPPSSCSVWLYWLQAVKEKNGGL